MENQEQVQAPEQGSATPAQPELTVNDLAGIRSVIDVAVRRGAFGASEMLSVGTVFDKLDKFLNAVNPPAETK